MIMWRRPGTEKPSRLLARFVRGGRFVRNDRGTTLIEFGLLALPFFAIVAAILETAFVFLAANVLDGSLDYATRLLRTGQAQQATPSPYTITEYRAAMCDRLFGLFDCDKLKLRVHTVTSFATASVGYPLDPDTGDWVATELYKPGTGGDIVIAEAYYKWPTLVDLFSFNLSNDPDHTRLLASVRTFKNEPF